MLHLLWFLVQALEVPLPEPGCGVTPGLKHECPPDRIVALARVSAKLEDGRAAEVGVVACDDPERFAGGVGVDDPEARPVRRRGPLDGRRGTRFMCRRAHRARGVAG